MKKLLSLLALTFPLLAQTYSVGGANGSGGSDCVTTTFTSVVGDTITAALSTTSGATAITPTASDAKGNTYTQIAGSPFSDTGGNLKQVVWKATVTAGGTLNAVTLTDGNGSTFWKSCAAVEHSNALTTDRISSASNIGTVNWVTGTTAATVQAVEVLLGIFSFDGSDTWTPLGGYTTRQNGNTSNTQTIIQDLGVSSTGAYQATGTAGSALNGVGTILTLYLPSGGGGGVRKRVGVSR